MTSVRKSRGILSLDKHLALSAAVTSWNASWHKVAPQAKNKLWRYTTDQGKIQENFYLSEFFSGKCISAEGQIEGFYIPSYKHLQSQAVFRLLQYLLTWHC